MPSKSIHFDTIYSTYLTNSSNSATTTPNCYDVQFVLPQPLRNVNRIALKSVEMPVLWGQTRGVSGSKNSTGYYEIKLNGTTYTFVMPTRVYASIDTFITDWNTYYTAAIGTPSGLGGVLSITTSSGASGNKHYLALTFATSVAVVFVDVPLSNAIMGFRNLTNSGTATVFTATGRYNLNADNYVSLYLANVPASDNSVSGKPCTFKLPVSVGGDSILYYSDMGVGYEQFVSIDKSYRFTMDRLIVKVYDRWGYNIDPLGGDYTFTLQIDYEE
jgi:hypothetical protein